MKKIIVNGVCASLVCFFLSSFTANSNTFGSTSGAPLQDTTHKMMKKKMKMDKTTGDTTKMKMKKKPS